MYKFNVDNSPKGKRKRTYNGVLFDSNLELRFYTEYLLPLKDKGIITRIILQPKYLLLKKYTKYGRMIREINYVGDFEVFYASGKNIVYDVKGLPTAEAKIKRKIFDFVYPEKILYWVVYSTYLNKWVQYETYLKIKRNKNKEASHESENFQETIDK